MRDREYDAASCPSESDGRGQQRTQQRQWDSFPSKLQVGPTLCRTTCLSDTAWQPWGLLSGTAINAWPDHWTIGPAHAAFSVGVTMMPGRAPWSAPLEVSPSRHPPPRPSRPPPPTRPRLRQPHSWSSRDTAPHFQVRFNEDKTTGRKEITVQMDPAIAYAALFACR